MSHVIKNDQRHLILKYFFTCEKEQAEANITAVDSLYIRRENSNVLIVKTQIIHLLKIT